MITGKTAGSRDSQPRSWEFLSWELRRCDLQGPMDVVPSEENFWDRDHKGSRTAAVRGVGMFSFQIHPVACRSAPGVSPSPHLHRQREASPLGKPPSKVGSAQSSPRGVASARTFVPICLLSLKWSCGRPGPPSRSSRAICGLCLRENSLMTISL